MSLGAPPTLPGWAREVRELFVSGAASQFLLHGNVGDLVAVRAPDGEVKLLALRDFLEEVLLVPFEVVVFYDRGRGLRVRKGQELFQKWLEVFDRFQGTQYASLARAGGAESAPAALERSQMLPRDPRRALELADRFLRAGLQRTREGEEGARIPDPVRTAVILDHAQFLVPRGEALHLAGEAAETLIRILDWAADPQIHQAPVATFLVAPNVQDLNRQIVENPFIAKVHVPLPSEPEMAEFVEVALSEPRVEAGRLEVPVERLPAKLVGLTRAGARAMFRRTLGAGRALDLGDLSRIKKELIEKECQGLLEFVESPFNLDMVAGHEEARKWLRQDAQLLRAGAVRALPMGYLVTGRIGTGKTFLVECWAGELGLPMVEIKNFRDRWVGATEGNLETIFRVLKALGQVVVFVDEADQMTGRRESGPGDSGLSGRIYGMLAQEMADTRNRGRILWVFATSRPDLLEVDLKRQGRLDVHIPLFPPQDVAGRRELLLAMGRKLKIALAPEQIDDAWLERELGGNEIESLLVRAGRLQAIAEAGRTPRPLREILEEVFAEARPPANALRLELMDLLAVEECTDVRFLPERFRQLPLERVRARIAEIQALLG